MRFPLRVPAVLVACGALVWIVGAQGPAYVAHRRLEDIDWRRSASRTERRDTAHRALALWLGDPHDAFLVLLEDGRSFVNRSAP